MAVLEVTDLRVSFPAGRGRVRVVDGVSFSLGAGQTLGLIGETGSGKSVTAQAVLGMVPPPGRRDDGHVLLHLDTRQIDITSLDPTGDDIRQVRGGEIALVFQDAASSLSPARSIGSLLCEALLVHRSLTGRAAEQAATDLLTQVGLGDPDRRLREYPHQLSGGMCQKVALALALAGNPRVLIADEPTTALDPGAQIEIVQLIRRLQRDTHLAVLFITHDLRLAAEACDQVAVMYAGQVVEHAPSETLLRQPRHPYTSALLASAPRLGEGRRLLATIPGPTGRAPGVSGACRFVDRCQDAIDDTCRHVPPPWVAPEPGHEVSCHLYAPSAEG